MYNTLINAFGLHASDSVSNGGAETNKINTQNNWVEFAVPVSPFFDRMQ